MTAGDVVGMVSVLFAGMLAGEEFLVRYGVRGPLASLDDRTHIQFRQALIRPMRVLVPALYVAALLAGAAATALDGTDAGLPERCAGIAVLVVWIAVTIGGTVPINSAAMAWDPDAPPASWRAQVERWERLNTVRMWAAVVAFALLLTGIMMSAAAS
jgi:uncharacterized membrane protein